MNNQNPQPIYVMADEVLKVLERQYKNYLEMDNSEIEHDKNEPDNHSKMKEASGYSMVYCKTKKLCDMRNIYLLHLS